MYCFGLHTCKTEKSINSLWRGKQKAKKKKFMKKYAFGLKKICSEMAEI